MNQRHWQANFRNKCSHFSVGISSAASAHSFQQWPNCAICKHFGRNWLLAISVRSISCLLQKNKKKTNKQKKINKNNNKIKERKRPKDNAIEKRRFISIYFRLRRVFFYLLRHSDFVCLLAFLSGSSRSRDPLNQLDSSSSFVSNRSADVTVHYSNRQHM